jgi:hypothetical protein
MPFWNRKKDKDKDADAAQTPPPPSVPTPPGNSSGGADNGSSGATNPQTLSALLRGMQYAVNAAQVMLQEHQFKMMRSYFNSETGEPDTYNILFPDGNKVYFPKITLIPQTFLAIDEVDMSFSVEVRATEQKKVEGDIKGAAEDAADGLGLDRTSLVVNFAPGARQKTTHPDGSTTIDDSGNRVNVDIKFKSIPMPEGAARILDKLNMSIGTRENG